MSRSILLALTACALVLSGCESMYGGVDAGLANVGAVKRGDNLYDVVYLGKDKKTPDYHRDMAMMQSAELCKAKGFRYVRASDTQAYSNFSSPEAQPAEAPQLTLQVSCHEASDAENTVEVESVIARITSQYAVN